MYDMRNDPDERINLVDDASHAKQRRMLQGELEAWFDRYSDPKKDGRGCGVTGTGQLKPMFGRWDNDHQTFAGLED